MVDHPHETLLDRIEAWRVATEAAKRTPKDTALIERRDQLLAELRQEIVDPYEASPPLDQRVSLAAVLADVPLKGRTAEDILVEVLTAIGTGPFPAVDNDDWSPARGWPDRQWLIPGWLPLGRLGMLSGRGGRGKSRLALQLAAGVAAHPPRTGVFLPPATTLDTAVVTGALQPLEKSRCGCVVYASWEDERDEIGRRLAALANDELGNKQEELRGRLRFVDLRGAGPLWAPAGGGHVQTVATLTAVGRRLRATVENMQARLLIVDSLAGAYAGDENVRALVRAFCADWDAWASAVGCTVMLVAHPPKTPGGAGAGTVDRDYAGSTDWHAAARWRWTLELAPTGRQRDATTPNGKSTQKAVEALALACAKSSYGPQPPHVFVAPSASGIGWMGVTAARAAQAAAAAGGFTLVDVHDADGEAEATIRR